MSKENIEKLMSEKNVQFRSFEFRAKKEQKEDKEELIVEGSPVVFENETYMGGGDGYEYREVIDKDAFAEADMSDVIFNMNHGGRVFARTRNNTLELSLNDKTLDMRAHLFGDDEGHRQLYRDIERKNLDKMSFAFTVKEDEYTERHIEGRIVYLRRIKKVDRLFDVSAVDIPAYDATSISARSAFDSAREGFEKAASLAEAERRKALDLALAKFRFAGAGKETK